MSELAYGRDRLALVDLVDRILAKGATVAGDVTLAVADVDLVRVSLRALIASVATVGVAASTSTRPRSAAAAESPPPASPTPASTAAALEPAPPAASVPQRVMTDPERAERGLAQLVLTLVELLRQLMERQAMRRVDDGTLDDDEIERLGVTFLRLEQRMDELRRAFDLRQEDLNLDLGPLGQLV